MAAQAKNRIITKKLVPSVYPDGMAQEEKARLNELSAQEAAARAEAIAAECLVPVDATVTLKFRLCRHGKHWQGYYFDEKKRRWVGLLPAPSLLSSALGALESEMYRESVIA